MKKIIFLFFLLFVTISFCINNNKLKINHINNHIYNNVNNDNDNRIINSKLIHFHDEIIDTTLTNNYYHQQKQQQKNNNNQKVTLKESLYLVHLEGPIKKSTFNQLVKSLNGEILNGEIIQYIPDNTYLISILNGANANSVNQLKLEIPSVQWLKPLDSRLKLSPQFKSINYLNIKQLKVYYHNHQESTTSSSIDTLIKQQQPSSNISKQSLNGNNILITIDMVTTDAVESFIYWLSTQSLVYWIEPLTNDIKHMTSNKNTHYSTQNGNVATTTTPIWNIGLKGDNEVIGCSDTGIDVDHCFFYDAANPVGTAAHRKIISYTMIDSASGDQTDQLDGHGTHVVGTILGSSNTNIALEDYNGGAPNSKIAFVDLQLSTAPVGQLSIPGNSTFIYETTKNAGAGIHCDAWNSNIGPFYTGVTALIDQYQFDNKEFLVVRSTGNNVNYGYSSMYTLSQESTSKNSLVVGSYNQPSSVYVESIDYWDWDFIYTTTRQLVCVQGKQVYGLLCSDLPVLTVSTDIQTQCCGSPGSVLSNLCCKTHVQSQFSTNTTAYSEFVPSLFSGIGPTSDGRLKPDLLAPGSPVISSRSLGTTSTPGHCEPVTAGVGITSTTSIVAMEGSSQSTAVITSAAALVRQFYRQGYFIDGTASHADQGFIPSSALIKATLINTATTQFDPTTSSLSLFSQGFGTIQLSKLIGAGSLIIPSSIGNKTDLILNTEEFNSFCFSIDQITDIDVTLVWTDPAGSPLSPISLVNNLDLVVLQFLSDGSNNVSVYYGNDIQGQQVPDTLNNVEVVRIKQAAIGRYDIKVYGTNIPIPDQPYAIVIRSSSGVSLVESVCSECFYDPNNDQQQYCEVSNGVGTQVCNDDNQFSTCKIYSCDTGYVYDNGITKSCITTLALTLYNIVLLAVFGIIIVSVIIFVLVCYKSKSLDQDKYFSLSKDKNNGGNGNSSRSNSMANNNGKQSDTPSSIELGQVDGSGNGGDSNTNGGDNGGIEEINNLPQYDEDGRLISGQEVEISIMEVISLGKPESKILGLALFLSFVDIALGLAVPLVAANIFDFLYSDSTSGEISTTILTFALIIIGMIVVQFLSGILLALAGHKIIARLRREMFTSLLKQDMAFFNERKTGELMSRLASDVSSVRSIISDSIPHMITQLATICGTLIMLFIISWKLSLVVLCPLPILLVFSKVYGGYIEVISVKVQDALADAATHAAETLFNMKTVRWFSAEEREVSKFAKLIQISYKIALKMTIWNGIYSSTSGIFEQLSVFILLWYGSSLVRNGDLTPSMLIAFNLFLPFITSAVTQVASLYTTYKSYKGSSYRFFEIMQRTPDIQGEGGIVRSRVQGNIEFSKVNFAYSSNPDQLILENIDIKFEPGTITALIGPSGGGKSTMLSLIGRLYNIDSGSISLDNTDIKDFNVPNLHEHISIVNQEPSLFSGTIAENIMYGKPSASRQEIIDACKQANAHDFIMAMPDGYDTLIGERGTSLSGGQKQRIAIARTIIKNPTVLLLDETTSELDVESEKLVQDSIDKLVVGRTVIIVAHRLTTILTADIIAVVSESRITEKGTPEELLVKKGMFYDFVKIQYGKEGEDLEITLPSANRNNRNTERLRNRSETIKQIAKANNIIPISKVPRDRDDNDESGSGDQYYKKPNTPSSWTSAKKDNSSKKSMLLARNKTQQSGGDGWQRGNVEDKLQRVLQKSRKKGFSNNTEHKDIKATLVLY